MLKIDVFSHVLPPRYLKERNARASFGGSQYGRYYKANPALTDLDLRFRVMDKYPDVVQLRREFHPLYERMVEYDLPILLHPRRANTTPDYEGEATSKFLSYTNFGWPYETSKAMARLAFGGVLERFPTLKFITHHAGGLIPYFAKRVELSWDFNETLMGYQPDGLEITKPPLEYYRMFYCDTAIQGNTPALMCAYDFFGADHMLFATDSPYDSQFGERLCEETIPAVEAMAIGDAERQKIFQGNARRLFRLRA